MTNESSSAIEAVGQMQGGGDHSLDRSMAAQEDALVARLGEMIKARRAGRFTIEALGARAGISAGLISQIERGIGNPSFGTLVRLSQALGFPLSAMFEGQDVERPQMVVRRRERRRLVVTGDGTSHEILVPDADHKLGVLSTVFPAGFASPETPPYSHPGEEVVLVLSGTLHATVGNQEFILDQGDTLTFDSTIPHSWENRTRADAEVLFISTPPSIHLVR